MLDQSTQEQIEHALQLDVHCEGYVYGPYHSDVSEQKPLQLGRLTTQICGYKLADGTQCGAYIGTPASFRRHVRSHFIKLTTDDKKNVAKVRRAESAADLLVPQLQRVNITSADRARFRQSCLNYVLDGQWQKAKFAVEPTQVVKGLQDAITFCKELAIASIVFAKAFGSPLSYSRTSSNAVRSLTSNPLTDDHALPFPSPKQSEDCKASAPKHAVQMPARSKLLGSHRGSKVLGQTGNMGKRGQKGTTTESAIVIEIDDQSVDDALFVNEGKRQRAESISACKQIRNIRSKTQQDTGSRQISSTAVKTPDDSSKDNDDSYLCHSKLRRRDPRLSQ